MELELVSVNKKIVIISIIITSIIFIVIFSLEPSQKNDNVIVHVILADPYLY